MTQRTQQTSWVVEARNLYKTFAWTPILNDLSCRIASAEVVGVFGPNGAGKTTLLRLLATLLTPTAGKLTLFGSASSELAIRRKIGFLGHESYLYPDLTPRREPHILRKSLSGPGPQGPHCSTSWNPSASGTGGRCRSVISRVGWNSASVLRVRFYTLLTSSFLTSPTPALDPRGLSTLHATLARAKDQKKTVILTSHDFERSRELCTRALILHRGRIAWQSEAALPSPQEFAELYTACTR